MGENKISKLLVDNWTIVFIAYCILCFILFVRGNLMVDLLSKLLELAIQYRIAWYIIFISFGGKIIHELLIEKIIIKSGFISILSVITEGATFGVIIDSSLRFLNALVKQFWEKGEERVIYFVEGYFRDFEFLTLTFAAIFLLFYSLISAFDAIKDTFRKPSIATSTISPLGKSDFNPDTNV